MKLRFVLCLLLIYTLSGCEKDNDKEKEPDFSKIDNVVGYYSGDYNSESDWVLYNPTITKTDDNTLIINYWPASGDSLILNINGNNLFIREQTFDLEAHSLAAGHLYYYQLKISGSGTFKNDIIDMSFLEKIKREDDNAFAPSGSGTIHLVKQP